MDLLANLCIGLGCLVWAQSNPLAAQSLPQATAAGARGASGSAAPDGASRKGPEEGAQHAISGRSPWFIILNSPQDLDELWRKIERPDLVLMRGDRLSGPAIGVARGGNAAEMSRARVESVKIAGRVVGENADLSVEYVIALKQADSVWVPIRLDNQRVIAAREATRDLSLRVQDRGEWQVNLAGEGEHRIRVDLKAAVSSELVRKRLSLAIPEAASTRVELNFARRESDVLIGADEDYGLTELGQGKGALLAAPLSPRSKLEVSWSDNADSGEQPTPLVTAQGEIAIDIDAQQMRTRSSWLIRCVRGVVKNLVLQVDEHDEITELELDDESLEDDINEARGPGKLTIPLDDPIRAGASKRLVLSTRRSLAKSGAHRASFAGFTLAGCASNPAISGSPAVRTSISERRRREACTGSMRASCRPTCGRGHRPTWPTSFRISRSRSTSWSSRRLRRCAGKCALSFVSNPTLRGARRRSMHPGSGAICSSSSSASRRACN